MRKINTIILVLSLLWSSTAGAESFLDKKQVKLGETVPAFRLNDAQGQEIELGALKGKIVFLHFWSATCPFVKRYEDRLREIAESYKDKGVVLYAINSNSNEDLNLIQETARERSLNYPVLIDKGNIVADQFGAITTPHVFILDAQGRLAYEGAVDDQGWSESDTVRQNYARDALEALLSGQPVATPQTKTVGCTVKRA